jgi:hypothetical protein
LVAPRTLMEIDAKAHREINQNNQAEHIDLNDFQRGDKDRSPIQLVRHWVPPEDAAGTAEMVRFLSQEVSKNTSLNIIGPESARIQSLPLSRPRQTNHIRKSMAMTWIWQFGQVLCEA